MWLSITASTLLAIWTTFVAWALSGKAYIETNPTLPILIIFAAPVFIWLAYRLLRYLRRRSTSGLLLQLIFIFACVGAPFAAYKIAETVNNADVEKAAQVKISDTFYADRLRKIIYYKGSGTALAVYESYVYLPEKNLLIIKESMDEIMLDDTPNQNWAIYHIDTYKWQRSLTATQVQTLIGLSDKEMRSKMKW